MNLQPITNVQVNVPSTCVYADHFDPGSSEGEWGVDENRCNRVYTVKLKCTTLSQYSGALQVIQSCPVRIGATYSYPIVFGATEIDTGSFLQSIHAVRDTEAGGMQWTLTLQYAPNDIVNLMGNADVNVGIINPLDRFLDVYWAEPAKYKRSKPTDESQPVAKVYLNTAGDPLIDPPETEETRPVLVVIRNESTYNDQYASQFKDAVNQDAFLGYPPNTVKCKDINAEGRFWDPDWGWYFKVKYQFEFRVDDDNNGYTQLIASLGYRQLVNGTGSPVNILDANGNEITDAAPLQQNGSYRAGQPPYFIPFQEFPQVNFADLNIPDDILYIAQGNT